MINFNQNDLVTLTKCYDELSLLSWRKKRPKELQDIIDALALMLEYTHFYDERCARWIPLDELVYYDGDNGYCQRCCSQMDAEANVQCDTEKITQHWEG